MHVHMLCLLAVFSADSAADSGSQEMAAETIVRGQTQVYDEVPPVGQPYGAPAYSSPYGDPFLPGANPYGAGALPFSQNTNGIYQMNSYGTRLSLRHFAGEGVANRDSFTTFELFQPFWQGWSGMWFVDGRLLLDNHTNSGGNIGAGYRYLDPWMNRLWGASLWYDVDDTHRETFHQVGISLESLGDFFDFRTNVYIPVGDTEETTGFSAAAARFSGRGILLDRTRFEEVAMTGLDIEGGVPVPGFEPYSLRAYAGYYFFDADGNPDLHGVSGRVEGYLLPNLSLQLELTHDRVFDTNLVFAVSVFFGGEAVPASSAGGLPYRAIRGQSPTYDGGVGVPVQSGFGRSRLYDTVQRNYNVVVAERNTFETVTAVDPLTGLPLVVRHLDSNVASNGTGTFESPFNSDTSLLVGSSAGDVLFVHSGSTIDDNVTLLANQRLLGQAPGVTHLVDTQFGTVTLPVALSGSTAPILSPLAGDAVTIPTTAGSYEVSGFTIQPIAGSGIVGTDVDGQVTVSNNTIIATAAGQTGIMLASNGSAIFTILDNTITADLEAIDIDSDGAAAAVSATLSGNTATSNNGNAIDIDANGGGDIELNLNGNTVTAFNGIGISIDDTSNPATPTNIIITGFANNTVDGTPGGTGGILISESLFDANPSLAGFQSVSAGNTTIGELGDRVSGKGLSLTNVDGVLAFSNLNVFNQGDNGVEVKNGATTNDFTLNGTFDNVNTMNGAALNLDPLTTNLTINTLVSTNAAGASGIFLSEVSGTLNIGAATITNAGTNGVDIDDSDVAVTIGTLNVDGAMDGIELIETTTTGSGSLTVLSGNIQNVTGDAVNATDYAFLSLSNMSLAGGDNAVDVNTTIAATSTVALNNNLMTGGTGSAVDIDGTVANPVIITSFANNTVLDAGGTDGVTILNATFDADPFTSGIQQVSGGNLRIGSNLMPIMGDGLRLDQVRGDLAFNDLTIINDAGTGLFVRDAGGKTGTFALSNASGQIVTTGGTAMDIDPVVLDMTFSQVSATGAGTNTGIVLDTVSGSLTINSLNLDADTQGVSIVDSTAAISLNGGTIADTVGTATEGILITDSTNVTVQAVTISGSAPTWIGIDVTSADGGTYNFTNNIISNAVGVPPAANDILGIRVRNNSGSNDINLFANGNTITLTTGGANSTKGIGLNPTGAADIFLNPGVAPLDLGDNLITSDIDLDPTLPDADIFGSILINGTQEDSP